MVTHNNIVATPKRIVVGLSNSLYGDIALRHAIRISREGDSIIGLYIAAPVQVQLNGGESFGQEFPKMKQPREI